MTFLQAADPGGGIVCDVRLKGQISKGDLAVLERHLGVAKERTPTSPMLCLDSQGGNLEEALLIAEMVIQFGVNTGLEADAACLSACAFVFMAGTAHRSDFHGPKRVMHASATLGFHAPYLGRGSAEAFSRQLEQLRATSSEAVIADAIFKSATNSSRLILALLARSEYDRYTFVRRPWIKPSLIAELLRMAPNKFFYVDSVGKAGNYDIEVTGYRPPSGDIREHVEDVCMNLHKWERDNFGGIDIPVRLPPSGWNDQEERRFRGMLLGEDTAADAVFAEVEDGGGGGPICGLRVDGRRERWEGDCDHAQLAVRGPWGGETSNLKSFCVEKWQRYNFATQLAAIAEPPPAAAAAPAALDAAGAVARSFFDAMSRPAADALRVLGELYAAEVDYYGRKRSRDEVLQDRRALFERWPTRAYVAEWGPSTVRCDAQEACAFDGAVYFKTFSPARNANVEGVAEFSLRLSPGEARIVSEDSQVLSREESAEPFTERWSFQSEIVD